MFDLKAKPKAFKVFLIDKFIGVKTLAELKMICIKQKLRMKFKADCLVILKPTF